MAGSRGPVPKPASQRRRRNKDAAPLESVPVAPASASTSPADAPKSEPDWHPVARRWFDSLAQSGQARFYEPSDWATAFLVAEGMHRLLSAEKMSAQLFQSVLAGTSALLATEGDRRRLRLELARGPQIDEDQVNADATVTDLRSRLGGG